jgi:DNA polymerase III delta subunit
MIHLLLGEDSHAKDKKINDIKSAILTKPEAIFFDYESLEASQVNAAGIKKSLMALPTFAPKRLILIRHVEKLKADPAAVLLDFASRPASDCEIILEASGELKSPLKDIASYCKVSTYGVKQELNIFDLTKLMSLRKTTDALKMLHEFYNQGMYPLQMMGAIVWYWGKEGRNLGAQKFERGLRALEEADLNIKRSRLLPEHALEKLVVELVELQK